MGQGGAVELVRRYMGSTPRIDGRFDSTFAMFRDPYRFISRECHRLGTDVFQSRFLFHRTTFMTGKAAAEVFYDTKRFKRRGAAPEPLRATLLGRGGVQGLDGIAHHHRKHMFMSLVSGVSDLVAEVEKELAIVAPIWASQDQIKLYDEMQTVLTKAVCRWAGIFLSNDEVRLRTRDFAAMFDGAGDKGWRQVHARYARSRAESWITSLVERARQLQFEPRSKTPFEMIVWHRDEHGHLLDPPVAAVEVLNLVRPTVAVSAFVVFGAHALQTHPQCATQLKESGEEYANCFVEEVRRFYPFFPSAVACVETNFEWRGYSFRKGDRAILDLFGTNHDPREWDRPNVFRPERFRGRSDDPYSFIPQGGGPYRLNHRCPGERIATEIMKATFKFLVSKVRYDVLPQDLDIAWSHVPAIPRSRFVLSNVSLL